MENTVGIASSVEIRVRLDGNSEIKYNLIKHNSDTEYGVKGECFGIELTSVINGEREEAFLEDVARDYTEALDLVMLLARNTVTPETAPYIMEDLLS